MQKKSYFIGGSWGDAILCYNNICKNLDELNLEKAYVIFYGLDFEVVKFLKLQDRIDKISVLSISEFDKYLEYLFLSKNNFSEFKKLTGLNNEIPDLVSAYSFNYKKEDIFVELPEIEPKWHHFYSTYKNYIVFNPFSCHSSSFTSHWPFWMDSLKWILDNFDIKVVLTGQMTSRVDETFKFPLIEHSNLINLVEKTSSMFDVFNIVNGSKGLITTSSGLSLWSYIFNKPTITICNKDFKEKHFKKYEWIKNENNSVFDYELTLEDFKLFFNNFYSTNFRDFKVF
jgi:hypothetical protein